ncbi:MAG TPA: hypothetical protein VFS43_16340 [Polyangiaceae bacterium]|nr:hypothetical protein [Polyangiaceae bacterium]
MSRRTRPGARPLRRALAALLVAAPGCSLAIDFVIDRCETDEDCASKGAAYQGTVCYEGACRGGPPVVARPEAWACVDAGPPAGEPPPEITVGLRFVDLSGGMPLAGVSVTPCGRLDVTCAMALGSAVLSDASGRAELRVPTAPAMPGEPGFSGYFLVSAEGRESVLLSFHPPLIADREETTPLSAAGQFAELAGFSGLTLDPGRGNAVLLSANCNGEPGAEVIFQIEDGDELSAIYYSVDGAPSRASDETDALGTAFAINLPPGYVALNASLDDGDNEFGLARFSVLSRPGFLTVASVAPDR